jgi:orotidine-5'-phosphate decarboxylase
MIIDRLIDAIIAKRNPSVIGIDTAISLMPDDMRADIATNSDAAKKIYEFNSAVIDAVCDIAPAVKVQAACYEAYGTDGMAVFRDTLSYARSKGLLTIADIKRNDIGSTSAKYSAAYLSVNDIGVRAEYDSDFITINGYLGSDGVKPFTDDCIKFDKGAFILVKTSNQSSDELQNIETASGLKIYEIMGDLVSKWGEKLTGKYGYSAIGAVVGATHKEEANYLRRRLRSVFFLVPGYGAQGGKASELEVCFDERGLGAIINSSRGIITAYKKSGKHYADAARDAAIEMREDILSALISKGKTKWLYLK